MRPTSVRWQVLAATVLVAIFMYVDRACLGQVTEDVKRELHLEPWQIDVANGAFFFSYALAQVFSAAVAVQFGLRHTFAVCLFLWSAFTVLTGLAGGFVVLVTARLLVGVSEAGAYPIAASLVRNWFPLHRRGFASSLIALGGRFGGYLSLLLTPVLVVAFAAYPKEVHGAIAGGPALTAYDPATSGWRATLQVFGLLGMGYAVVYWLIARDRAADHPRANVAEIALVPKSPPKAAEPFPLLAIITSGNLWLSSLTQCCINVGWAFVITKLGDYLEKGHGLTGAEKGFWTSLPLGVGIAGMFAGGFITDGLTKRFGLRWGRSLPIGVSLFVCSIACGVAASTTDYQLVVGMLCVMAVFVDLGIPAVWAFAQDIGGRHTGAALGWANMWGNLGAAASPVLLGWVQRSFATPDVPTSGWPAAFAVCACTFAVAAVAALGLNAGRPLTKPTV
jgi:ACS family glucarate transporter-like MFS transporter